ncbi:hypothetical protein AX15_002765 [Amanita polypyramis BW_CC]|nr:hypothetical protein AX15_002765 [Amanita polypyramis BW_CC]
MQQAQLMCTPVFFCQGWSQLSESPDLTHARTSIPISSESSKLLGALSPSGIRYRAHLILETSIITVTKSTSASLAEAIIPTNTCKRPTLARSQVLIMDGDSRYLSALRDEEEWYHE